MAGGVLRHRQRPIRFRPMMIPAMIEKFGHVAMIATLYARGWLTAQQSLVNLPDLILGTLFVIAFLRTRRQV